MLCYDDDCFDLYAEDDSQEVTCAMCHEDCPLALIKSGCCAYCASLCQSAPVKTVDPFTRRAHLVSLTRKAFVAWDSAVVLFSDRKTALRPSQECIEEAAELVQHRARRYELLTSRLAEETGLAKFSINNDIARFPSCSRLLRAGL